MKKRRRLSTVLRELARELELSELSRRAGVRITKRMIGSGKAPERVQEAIRDVEARRERARAAAHAKELRKTRIKEDVKPDELARAMGVTKRTAKKWIERGGAPPRAHDVAISIAMGEKPYREPKTGTGKAKIAREKVDRVEKTMRDFVGARRRMAPHKEVQKLYRRWVKAKEAVRGRMSRQKWRALIERLGEELDLPDVGVFSKERFRKS